MSIFDQPIRPSSDVIRGVVLAVDPNSHTCSVKTYLGQVFYNCNWLLPTNGADRDFVSSAPSPGTQVVLHTGSGIPIILGCLPMPQQGAAVGMVSNLLGESFPTASFPNINPISIKNSTHAPSSSQDTFPGDHVFQTPGGSTLAVLQHSLLLRAGAQSQIFISKLDDIVRVAGRNWERFNDSLTDVAVNFRGRGYAFKGASLNVSDQKYSYYNYYEVLGDVAAGEALKEYSYSQPASAAPPSNTLIQKEKVQSWANGTPTELASKTWDGTTGTLQWIIGPITFTYASSGWSVVDAGSNASIELIDGKQVYLNYGAAEVTMTSSSLVAAFDSSQVTLNSSESVLASNGHAVTVNGSGVALS